MIRLETERLILTPPTRAHLAALHGLHNDPLVQASIYGNQPQSLADIRRQLDVFLAQWRDNGFGFWMVYEKTAPGRLIGRAGLRNYRDSDDLEFGYVFAAAAAGRGLGPEAARTVIRHALRVSTKHKVVGLIAPGNLRALQAAQRLGFRYVEDRRQDGRLWRYCELSRETVLQHWPAAG